MCTMEYNFNEKLNQFHISKWGFFEIEMINKIDSSVDKFFYFSISRICFENFGNTYLFSWILQVGNFEKVFFLHFIEKFDSITVM